MRIVLQRVSQSSVKVDNKIVGSIDKGLMALVSFTYGDSIDEIKYLVNKLINIRIFDDSNGIMNLSIKDIGGSVLSISQFTLYADSSKGNRPSYVNALNSDEAIVLYNLFNEELRKHLDVEEGIFGADMKVSLINDGPVTIILEKEKRNV